MNLFGLETQQIVLIVLLVLMVVVLIVLPMFSNKKRNKQVSDLHNSISVGDKIKTVGGIVGTVVAVNDTVDGKELVVETGTEDSKSTMVFDIQAVYLNLSRVAAPAPVPFKEEPEAEAIETEAAAELPVAEAEDASVEEPTEDK